jgi:alanine racemase
MPAESINDRLAAAGLPALPRQVWLEIDESALAGNLAALRTLVGADVAINAVVKADAYGHGLAPVARVFESAGADRLCVASLDEALVLRGAGVQQPILVLFSIPPNEVVRAARENIEIVAAERSSTLAALRHWSQARTSDTLNVHLEVETGLSRGGVKPGAVVDLARQIIDTPGTRLAGIWSHLATPDDQRVTQAQDDSYRRALSALREAGIAIPARHLSATGGVFTEWADKYEGIRPGLSLYGIVPSDLPLGAREGEIAPLLRPAMALKCRPLRIESLDAGTPVGYGGRWVTPRDSAIATLPVGYGDGWSRSSFPGTYALVRGQRVPLVGTVAMDALMADVTDVPGLDLDDEFVLIGSQGAESITAEEVARARNTIAWEVVTSMAYRLPRVYHAGPVLLGLRTLAGEVRGAVEAVA